MAPSLESGVRRRLENPTPDKSVNLMVEVDDPSEQALEALREIENTEVKDLPLDCVLVETMEPSIQEIYELDFVSRIEIEGKGSVMDSNFHNQTELIL